TLNSSSPSGEFPNIFSSDHGAGYRGVYDFSNLDESEFIIATGQSGHPLSQYYDDLSRHFAQNKYLRMSLNPDLARSNSIGTTTLQP
ncbi:MAG: penicillin acylase family protein, partial [Rhodobacteraceae bacterium]|nr:penicillin acylase family protein [Paracoccaceae bacterium]